MDETDAISAVVERAHDLAAVSHLIPSGEWTPALVALVVALHDLTAVMPRT